MKRMLLLSILMIICTISKAQTLSYNQLVDIFKTWTIRKDVSTLPILNKLRNINLNWDMTSRGKSGNTRYYAWSYQDGKSDTTVVALYIEEDDTSVKYGLRYAFYNRGEFIAIKKSIAIPGNYAGKITYFTDKSKNEFTMTGTGYDSVPIDSRTDLILTDYANFNDERSRLFTLDISSRYIKK